MFLLPNPSDTHDEINSLLDGVSLTLVWDYTERDQSWRISVLDQNDDSIRVGQKLNPGWNPLRRLTDERMPTGKFYLWALIDPLGSDAFSNSLARLAYFTKAEVDAINAETIPSVDLLFEGA